MHYLHQFYTKWHQLVERRGSPHNSTPILNLIINSIVSPVKLRSVSYSASSSQTRLSPMPPPRSIAVAEAQEHTSRRLRRRRTRGVTSSGVASTGVTSSPSGSLRTLRGRVHKSTTNTTCSSRATRRKVEPRRQGRDQGRGGGTPTAHGCEHGYEELQVGVSQSGTATRRPGVRALPMARPAAWQLGLGHVDEPLDFARPSSRTTGLGLGSLGAGLGAALLRWLHGRGLW